MWETEYIQTLASVDAGHAVRHFTQSTAMRPYVDGLDAAAKAAFIADYDAALDVAYPCEADGSVLFALKRLFFVIRT